MKTCDVAKANRYTRRQVRDLIVAKAMKDEAFRVGLLADPKGVVERQINGLLPDDFEVEILHEDSRKLFIVLPPNFPEDDELDEQ